MQAFRELVFAGIRKAAEHGATLRSYEGSVDLHFPTYIEVRQHRGLYSLRLSASVFGGGRHFAWKGKTWREVFAAATADVTQWIADLDDEDEDEGGDAP